MKKLQPHLVLLWNAVSVFFGPFIAVSQFSFTRGVGDYCDFSYELPDGSGFDPIRETEFARSNLYADSLSIVMLTVGAVLLFIMWRGGLGKKSTIQKVLLTLLSAVIALGYLFIIFVVSGKGGQSC